VEFFLHAELLKLAFKVYYGLFDPLLAFVTGPLTILTLNLFAASIPALPLIL
jgi:uncharacterized membrane protein YvlD (DUF360 family)